MMKIGILTFHRALNYGAVLQCYALQETLSKMGHDVEIIDYRPDYIEEYRKPLNWNRLKKEPLVDKLKRLLLLPLYWFNIKRASKAFDSFVGEHLVLFGVKQNINTICSRYNAIVFGSDQIWSPVICKGFDPVYWGQFQKGNARFIAYAPSYGGGFEMLGKTHQTLSEYLKVFDSLSTREEFARQALSSYTDKQIEVVLDPTLFATSEIFERIAIRPKEKDYVLLFTVEEVPDSYSFAERIAKENNCQVIKVIAIPNIREKEKGVRSAATPGEFCGYFKYARFVVAVSFHGTAFSIIFNKNFYTLHSKKEGRALNLLKKIGLENRLVNPNDVSAIMPVDYTEANRKLELLRKDSSLFIEKALQG